MNTVKSKLVTYDTIDVKWHTPEKLIEEIQSAFKKYGKENVTFNSDIYDDCGSTYCEIYLQCQRKMTEAEIEKHYADERQREESNLVWQRRQYEELKKKFEGK